MTDEQTELARRLVAHPRWRWKRGMVAIIPGWGQTLLEQPGICGPEDILDLCEPAVWGWLSAMLLAATGIWPGVEWAPDVRMSDAELGAILARALLDAWGEP